jgi:hypothetical protein
MFSCRSVPRSQFPIFLAVSWSALGAFFSYAGQPIDAKAVPTAAHPADPLALSVPLDNVLIAQVDEPPPVVPKVPVSLPPAATPSQNVTINLINRLVQRGVLSKDDAIELIKQAEEDAATARAQAEAVAGAAAQAVAAAQAAVAQVPPPAPPPSEDAIRVTYIPEIVKAQIRDQLKDEVLAQAKAENWAQPRAFPEWVARFRFLGDVRIRYEGDYFPAGNDNTGAFPNFNAINTGAPFDVSGFVFSPQLNVDQNRQRIRLRARLGAEVDLNGGFTAGVRIATGETNSPVSQNQSFGLANQTQGGNFSKYAIWLDRGFLKYQMGGIPAKDLSVTIGRFDNPFFATSIIWADDLGFDGAALQAKYQVAKGVTPFVAGGAFPVFNTDFNFSSIQPAKFASDDKYLYGGQAGVDWRIHKDFNLKVGGAYYYFDNVEGQLSDPFIPFTAQDNGNTDDTRPSFAQKGNTYMALRNIIPSVFNNFGTINQFQYFGLATPFHDLALTGKLDYNRWEPFQVSLTGEYIKNLAFDRETIDNKAVNNRGPAIGLQTVGPFEGGDTAWIAGLKVGRSAFEKRWDWAVGMNYRHVESDAVIDGFCDSDFGLGGTNLKGYTFFGALALSPHVSFGIRWMTADEIAGPPLKTDVLQVDFNGKF